MKREIPKEVWLFRFLDGSCALSFDPPTKRNAHRWHRMVPAAAQARKIREYEKLARFLRASIRQGGICMQATEDLLDALKKGKAKP